MTRTHFIIIFLALGAGLFFLGRASVGSGADMHATSSDQAAGDGAESVAEAPTLWTCPMHPQIKLPDEGDCPICGMDLVPMTISADDDPRRLVMTTAAKELARIVTTPVTRRNVSRPVRMAGKVDYNETAVRTISAWVGGRLDRLFVDYTGVSVNAGDHLVRIYSPELMTAQQELISAAQRAASSSSEASEFLRTSNERAYTAAREKLQLWGLTLEQVDAIEARGTAEDHVTISSPSSGVVIDKFVDQGTYVETGTPIYRIADLSELWVRLDAYEQDLAWLRHGQPVVLEIEALPGETFEGRIAYIDPFINERTRTAKVRVNVENSDGRLKPGMFVSGVATARLGEGGAVIDQYLAGKWVSPMHPEIVRDGPGVCDVCGMDLVPAEELGLVSAIDPLAPQPIVIPTSAALVTGKRAVVYVEVPGADRPTYEGREIVLGPRAGDEYIVIAGLKEGERVVVQGAFRIDSSMQILAKPSMMNMPGEERRVTGPEGAVFRASLSPLYEAYLALHLALAGDDFDGGREALALLEARLGGPTASGLPAWARVPWREELSRLKAATALALEAQDIEAQRAAFEQQSRAVLGIAKAFGHAGDTLLVEAFCPMAFDDKGASWLQAGEAILNPYFGASMLQCGDVRGTFMGNAIEPVGETQEMDAEHDHSGHAMGEAAGGMSGSASVPTTPLADVFGRYLALQEALAEDDAMGATGAAEQLLAGVMKATNDTSLDTAAMKLLHGMHSDLLGVGDVRDIEVLRTTFHLLSKRVIAIEKTAGNPLPADLQLVHCPMAFDDTGADWLQLSETIANPYFGATMLRCGAIQRVVQGVER